MGRKLDKFLEGLGKAANWVVAFISGALSSLLLTLLLVGFILACSGCSTGDVKAAMDISCVVASLKPSIEFEGIELGRRKLVVTNVLCSCQRELGAKGEE